MRAHQTLASGLALVVLGLAGTPRAEPHVARPLAAGPWSNAGDLPEWAESVRVLKGDEPILIAPQGGAVRRGSAAREARLPLFAAKMGPGCRAPWYSVGPHAWVCGDETELARETPIEAGARTLRGEGDGLPFRYYFVGSEGSFGYKKLRDADLGEPDFQFDKGFAVAIVEERGVDGNRYGRTGNDLWVPMHDLGPAHASTFTGGEVPGGVKDIPFAWVISKTARVFAGPTTARPTGESLSELAMVGYFEEAGQFEKMTRIADGKWVPSKDLRHPTVAPPPPEVDVEAHERWVDVDLATQTLVAYEGAAPVFATLVSTGKGKQGAYNATPKGTHRIWVKLTSANMDNLEDENANRYYRMENVPWVQFFDKGVGLHGAFWHHSFGHERSHGCVNLTPKDAERLFWFTTPRLPAGWTAILPSKDELGTVVRVR
jgi:lipoprotein-anchoring transpeptidase ErfK/SrfK